MSDESEQLDEILALDSIYGKDVFTCDVSKKPIAGQIDIHLQTDLSAFDILINGHVVPLKHLPPIIMKFLLPSNYPSLNPPDVKLSCPWMTFEQLDMLSNKLMDQWKENCCNVIFFTWINFLQFEVLEFLGIKFPLNICEDVMVEMTEHNLLREEVAFNQASFECPVCFCCKPGTKCIKLEYCNHVFCIDCLSDFATVHISEGSVNYLLCPAEKCDVQIFPHVIKRLVSQEDFERYDRLVLQNSLDIMDDIVYCPRIKCGKPVVVEKNETIAICNVCRFTFCINCKFANHGSELCMIRSEEAEKLMHDYYSSDDKDKSRLEQMYGRDKLLQAFSDMESTKWLSSNCKKCPNCKSIIEKSEGCNKMTCGKCSASFCWLCLEIITTSDPYLHFRNTKAKCFDKLYG